MFLVLDLDRFCVRGGCSEDKDEGKDREGKEKKRKEKKRKEKKRKETKNIQGGVVISSWPTAQSRVGGVPRSRRDPAVAS